MSPFDDGPAGVCRRFMAGKGGAHPWCDRCGWRRDFHPEPAPGTPRRDTPT